MHGMGHPGLAAVCAVAAVNHGSHGIGNRSFKRRNHRSHIIHGHFHAFKLRVSFPHLAAHTGVGRHCRACRKHNITSACYIQHISQQKSAD